jgi:hypothetical protein
MRLSLTARPAAGGPPAPSGVTWGRSPALQGWELPSIQFGSSRTSHSKNLGARLLCAAPRGPFRSCYEALQQFPRVVFDELANV